MLYLGSRDRDHWVFMYERPNKINNPIIYCYGIVNYSLTLSKFIHTHIYNFV